MLRSKRYVAVRSAWLIHMQLNILTFESTLQVSIWKNAPVDQLYSFQWMTDILPMHTEFVNC